MAKAVKPFVVRLLRQEGHLPPFPHKKFSPLFFFLQLLKVRSALAAFQSVLPVRDTLTPPLFFFFQPIKNPRDIPIASCPFSCSDVNILQGIVRNILPTARRSSLFSNTCFPLFLYAAAHQQSSDLFSRATEFSSFFLADRACSWQLGALPLPSQGKTFSLPFLFFASFLCSNEFRHPFCLLHRTRASFFPHVG